MKSQERRKESRVPYRTTVDLIFSDKEHKILNTRDLSVMGAFLEGVDGLDKGEKCKITITFIGEASKLTLNLKGEVVRVEEDGVALEFLDVNRDCFYHLKNIAYIAHVNPDDIICTSTRKPVAKSIDQLTRELEMAQEKDY